MREKKRISYGRIVEEVSMKEILEHYGEHEADKCPFCRVSDFRIDLEMGRFFCPTCKKKGGDVIDFVQKKEGVKRAVAAVLIQEWFGITPNAEQNLRRGIRKSRLVDDLLGEKLYWKSDVIDKKWVNPPLSFTLDNLDPNHDSFYQQEKIWRETVADFGMGYCSEGLLKGYIVVPVYNGGGELISYIGMATKDFPYGEYMFVDGFRKSCALFNLDEVNRLFREDADEFFRCPEGLIVVQEVLDCLNMWQAGYRNTVALMGDSMSLEQEKLIVETVGSKGRVTLFFNSDKKGRELTDKLCARLAHHVYVKGIKSDIVNCPGECEVKYIWRELEM